MATASSREAPPSARTCAICAGTSLISSSSMEMSSQAGQNSTTCAPPSLVTLSAAYRPAAFAQVRTECKPKFLALHDTTTLKTAKIEAYLATHVDEYVLYLTKACIAAPHPRTILTDGLEPP